MGEIPPRTKSKGIFQRRRSRRRRGGRMDRRGEEARKRMKGGRKGEGEGRRGRKRTKKIKSKDSLRVSNIKIIIVEEIIQNDPNMQCNG